MVISAERRSVGPSLRLESGSARDSNGSPVAHAEVAGMQVTERPWPVSDVTARDLVAERKTAHLFPVQIPDGMAEPDGDHWPPDISDSTLDTWTVYGEPTGRPTLRSAHLTCPLGSRGDRLWIQEAWRIERGQAGRGRLAWRAERPKELLIGSGEWLKPSRQPREYTRLILQLVDVSVVRLRSVERGLVEPSSIADVLQWRELWGRRCGQGERIPADPWCWLVRLQVVWRRFPRWTTATVDLWGRQQELDLMETENSEEPQLDPGAAP